MLCMPCDTIFERERGRRDVSLQTPSAADEEASAANQAGNTRHMLTSVLASL